MIKELHEILTCYIDIDIENVTKTLARSKD
jgi:hypothetical protein